MDDNNQATTLSNDPAGNAPDTATLGRDKGKATQDPTPMDVSMDEGESDESENEDIMEAFKHMLTLSSPAEEDEDGGDDLPPIDSSNIINGRRTRGKTIDFVDAAKELKDDEGEDDEDDEDFQP
ncbi:Histone chaperone domain CHZ [Aspergillus parasiticus SU-1]|uniref:Histone chaperone domain CHZ n=1 Tax=Aspergillus parasiticus (strain ATCC 56775 / NRRL 5862 / SRRC 143 / SU-1) TaxID=1403190 RepID=A0A0F0IFG5_ASPPU|nr:Histone chaperone domain CHZ [Aspergillus parasiticus SU-1]